MACDADAPGERSRSDRRGGSPLSHDTPPPGGSGRAAEPCGEADGRREACTRSQASCSPPRKAALSGNSVASRSVAASIWRQAGFGGRPDGGLRFARALAAQWPRPLGIGGGAGADRSGSSGAVAADLVPRWHRPFGRRRVLRLGIPALGGRDRPALDRRLAGRCRSAGRCSTWCCACGRRTARMPSAQRSPACSRSVIACGACLWSAGCRTACVCRMTRVSRFVEAARRLDGAAWLGWLSAGDTLSPCALSLFARAIHRHPAALLVYCDEDRLEPDGLRSMPVFKTGWDALAGGIGRDRRRLRRVSCIAGAGAASAGGRGRRARPAGPGDAAWPVADASVDGGDPSAGGVVPSPARPAAAADRPAALRGARRPRLDRHRDQGPAICWSPAVSGRS